MMKAHNWRFLKRSRIAICNAQLHCNMLQISAQYCCWSFFYRFKQSHWFKKLLSIVSEFKYEIWILICGWKIKKYSWWFKKKKQHKLLLLNIDLFAVEMTKSTECALNIKLLTHFFQNKYFDWDFFQKFCFCIFGGYFKFLTFGMRRKAYNVYKWRFNRI